MKTIASFVVFCAGIGLICVAALKIGILFYESTTLPPGYSIQSNGRQFNYVDENGSVSSDLWTTTSIYECRSSAWHNKRYRAQRKIEEAFAATNKFVTIESRPLEKP